MKPNDSELVSKQLDTFIDDYADAKSSYNSSDGKPMFYENMRQAKQSILALIQAEKIKELETITNKNYADELGTYDFYGIAESVFERIKTLKDSK